MQGVTKVTAASVLLLMVVLAGGVFAGAGGAAPAAACDIDPQLNHVTINQGLPYTRLVRGKETLVRFYLSLPSSIPKCGSTSRSIKIVAATLNVKNGQSVLNTAPIPAQPEAINAEITNTAPTNRNPSIPVNSPADPKFAVPGSVLAAGTSGDTYVSSFELNITYQSKGNDGVFTANQTATFPPSGGTPITRAVEARTKALRILVVPMGGALDQAASAAVGTGMSHLSRLFPVADGTNGTSTALRTAELTSTAGVLRYTVNSGVVSLTGLTDADGRFCGTSTPTNFAQIQTQLQGFRNAWNGVVNGVDSPQEQDADKVVGVIPELRSVSSTEGAARGCLEGFAMTNSNESWIRAVANMAGPLFAMEVCHTFGCVADTGTFHSLYTQADTQDPDRAYNVLDRNYISTDRTAMRLITPWTNDNTVMEKDHFAFLLCGFGGANTNGCPGAPGTGTLTGVAATSGSAIVMYGTVNKNTNVANVNSMESTGAPLTVADDSSEWRLVQRNASGIVGPPTGYGIPVRFNVSHHGAGGDDHGEDPVGSFNVAFPAEPTATTIELRRNGVATPLYTRTENNAPNIADVSTGGDDVVRLAFRSVGTRTAAARESGREAARLAPKPRKNRAKAAKTVLSPSGPARSEFGNLGGFRTLAALLQSGSTERVSVSSAGAQGNASSHNAAMTPDGRFVVFDSNATNLVEGDTNAFSDVFVRDRNSNTTERVSVADDETQGNGHVGVPASISDDGRYVAFVSTASNLVAGDTNGVSDMFVRDRLLGTTQRVSVNSSEEEANATGVGGPVISGTGRYVLFAARASNLDPDDTDSATDLFVRDLEAGTTEQVNLTDGDAPGTFADAVGDISDDGRYVTFATYDDTLVAGDTNGVYDAFIRDRVTGSTERLSVDSAGAQGTGGTTFGTHAGEMSADGNVVVLSSEHSNLVPGDTNGARDVFLKFRSSGAIERISVSSDETEGNGLSGGSLGMSANGRYVAFDSQSSNLVAGDTNGASDSFLRDRETGTTERVSLAHDGAQADQAAGAASVSDDGSLIEFSSSATNLVAGDTNSQSDIFVRNRSGTGGGGGGDTPTFTVNSANDATDAGGCTTTHCSLREAINRANATSGADTISFAIGTGTQTISPTTALPTITEAVTIDGNTQPGFAGTPIIEIAGTGTPAATSGLTVAAGPSTIRGLVINRFPWHGILMTGGSGNKVEGSYLGIGVDGTSDLGNGREGIRVETSNATIGGTTAAVRNVVSGNTGHGILLYGSTGSTVEGNYAGTNAQGAEAIANGLDGVAIDGGSNNIVKNNVASGNANQGIAVFAVDKPTTTGNSVLGNTVGMNAARSAPIANGHDGVRVHNGSNTTIGGTGTGAANVIAHNTDNGIAIFTDKDIDPLSSSTKMAMGNTVSANSIHTNGALGIDLRRDGPTANDVAVGGEGTHDSDQGTNDLQNFPVIRSVVGGTISGDLDSTPSTETTPQDFTIAFYASATCDSSGFGEGTRFLGTRTVRTSGSGRARFTFTPAAPGVAVGEWVTATATDQDGNTSEFSACRQAIAGEPAPEGSTPVTVSGTDEQPQNTRTFVFANCGGRQEPLLVDAPPSETAGTNYWVHFNFDPKPACAGPNGQLQLTVVTTDGFATSEVNDNTRITVSSPNERPFPSIATGGPFVQWDGITLHGYAFDDDEQLPAEKLVWESVGPNLLFSEPKTGFTVPLTRPSPSWTPGNYTVKLTATDSKGLSESVTKTITILGDADHDGWLDESDPNDNDPYDAYKDCDNDGIYNAEEAPGRLCEADLSFAGTATFQPDPLVLPYTGVVTMTMRLLNKNVADVQASSVELKRIDGVTVAGDPAFKATSVAITNTGVLRATFSGQNLSNWLTARPVSYNRRILVTMGGVSKTSPQWSFEGTGSTFVRRG